MARPLSDAKRDSILEAAAELVATQGTGASTSQIARAAQVAEGTVFTYFETKDELLNELFIRLEQRLFVAINDSFPSDGDALAQLQHVWNVLIDWGAANPADRKALRQLKVSERVTQESRDRCTALFGKVLQSLDQSVKSHVDAERFHFYFGQVLMSLVETTAEAVVMNPGQRGFLKQAGFDLFWRGIQRTPDGVCPGN